MDVGEKEEGIKKKTKTENRMQVKLKTETRRPARQRRPNEKQSAEQGRGSRGSVNTTGVSEKKKGGEEKDKKDLWSKKSRELLGR